MQENVCARHKSWQSSQLINQTVKDSWWIYHFQKSLLNPALWKIQQLLQTTDKYLLQSMLQIDFVWLYSFVLPFQFFKVNSESDKFSPLCCSKLQCFDWHGYIPSGGSWRRGIIYRSGSEDILCAGEKHHYVCPFSPLHVFTTTRGANSSRSCEAWLAEPGPHWGCPEWDTGAGRHARPRWASKLSALPHCCGSTMKEIHLH